ncbi:diguanylate cyclase (GGDEF) domain-containing protein [Evansella caseinilytica]|uniref:Diguanylate cyclase (GGDEF) domain-containing protein n=1 Tax=Evansella caseinilytica TaxID=1503961 RepID=A0A1H3RHR3_9BACI|nr:EAL domain-containing protein [Evansella caseinilytica]SDZ24479.1 diguanylate cyclase (GGDEF) domain-containing protein [Evansella caseinilytica]
MITMQPTREKLQFGLRRLVLFSLLFLLAFLAKRYSFQFPFGITYSFTSLFLLLILRLCGLKAGVISAVFLHVFFVVVLDSPQWEAMYVLEIAFIGAIMFYRRNGNMILYNMLFWFLLGIPLYAFYFFFFFELNGILLSVVLLNYAINGLANAIIADILLAYTPLFRWMYKRDRSYRVFYFHQMISHILIGAIVFPFLINMFVSNWNIYTNSSRAVHYAVKNYADNIERELSQWTVDDLHQLQYQNSNQSRYLSHLFELNSADDVYFVYLINREEELVAANRSKETADGFEWQEENGITAVENKFYRSLAAEQTNNRQLPVLNWSIESFIYKKRVNDTDLTLYIQTPIAPVQEGIFIEYMQQSRFFIVFLLLAVGLSGFIKRYLRKTLGQLAETTTGLPLKVKEMKTIRWPESQVYEVNSLINNFKTMSAKLANLFQESYQLNQKLENQTQMLQKSEEKLHKLAYYDILTELPNRQHFQQYLSKQIAVGSGLSPGEIIAVMFMDINQFKQINDTLGHSVGDELLKIIARKFQQIETEKTKVFRLGGDEFVVVMSAKSKDEVEVFGERIKQLFSVPLIIDDMTLHVSASVGASIFPQDGNDLDALVKYADIAMYHSKAGGRNDFQFFDSAMKEHLTQRMLLNNGLQEALKENQLEIHYQPRFDAQTAALTGMEALMRWKHPKLGNVSPDTFIAIAEESGLILKVDEWGLNEACKQNKRWQEEGFPKIPVSVNISVKHFYQGHLVEMARHALEKSHLEAKYLHLEITESLFIHHKKDVIDTVKELKRMGIKIAIDDFGKGYSSLIHLLKLPINEVKLDRFFIKDVHLNSKKMVIVKAITDIANTLKLNVVAEGVENEEEWKYIRQLRCSEVQGYLFSKPLSKEEFTAFLRNAGAVQGQRPPDNTAVGEAWKWKKR